VHLVYQKLNETKSFLAFAVQADRFKWNTLYIDHACSNFHTVLETSAEFGLQAGNMKFNTQNDE
jgi:hypothetical protein